jgi:hypothetical protein
MMRQASDVRIVYTTTKMRESISPSAMIRLSP